MSMLTLEILLTALREKSTFMDEQFFVSLTIDIPVLHFSDFYSLYPKEPRFFWSDRTITFYASGIGHRLSTEQPLRFTEIGHQTAAFLKTQFAPINLSLQQEKVPLLFGGFAFNSKKPDDEIWTNFPANLLILPLRQITKIKNDFLLTINMLFKKNDYFPEKINLINLEIQKIQSKALFSDKIPPPTIHTDKVGLIYQIKPMIDFSSWTKIVLQAISLIHHKTLQKLVLARSLNVIIRNGFDIISIITNLLNNYQDCYIFLFEPDLEASFFGASPELLVTTEQQQMSTCALAGTTIKGTNPEEEIMAAHKLITDPKERQEHAFVVEEIKHALKGVTKTLLYPDEPTILKIKNMQHLLTSISGQLSAGMNIFNVLECLHPTPAVGGVPKLAALALQAELEVISRGWYDGPLGWIKENLDGKFIVAIRSAVKKQSSLFLFAGAGIVAQSTPEQEWKETGLKFSAILDALTEK